MNRHTKAVMTALHCDIGEYDDHMGGGDACFEHETDINENGECIHAEHIATELANAGLPTRPLPDREELAKVIRDAIHGNPLTATFQMDLDAADAVLALIKGGNQ